MRFTIAPFYAALLTFGYVILALQVTRNRRRTRTVLGAGADRRMERAIRAHGNFAEYVPLALLLLGFAELQGQPAWLLHLFGIGLIAGRGLHALDISRENERIPLRVTAMALTFAVLIGNSMALLFYALR